MARFIHSILRANENQAADNVQTVDLPVNPLSAILLHLDPLNETSTIGNFGLVQRVLSCLDLVEVLYKGQAIVSINGPDLYAFNLFRRGFQSAQSNPVNTDNDRRSLIVPIILGRRAYDPKECFPRTKRGELQLQITWDIADTGVDTLRTSVETIELPDAAPEFFEKYTVLSQTFAATGNNDIDIPLGWPVRGLLAFGTTAFAGAAPAPTLGALSILVDNLQTHFASTDFEVSRMAAFLRGRATGLITEHLHGFVDAAAGQVDTQRGDDIFPMLENYTYLDLDPTDDDLYSLQTEGAGRVNLRVNAETANAVRIIPVQRVPVTFVEA